jgi:hypothetical protein
MSELNSNRMGELVIEALERTAFVLADICEDEDQAAAFTPTQCSTIAFEGLGDGRLLLASDVAFVAELASSLLGVEPEEVSPEAEGADALSELANIVGGSVMLEFGGADHEYTHGLPETIAADAFAFDAPGNVNCTLESETGMIRVTWMPGGASAKRAA